MQPRMLFQREILPVISRVVPLPMGRRPQRLRRNRLQSAQGLPITSLPQRLSKRKPLYNLRLVRTLRLCHLQDVASCIRTSYCSRHGRPRSLHLNNPSQSQSPLQAQQHPLHCAEAVAPTKDNTVFDSALTKMELQFTPLNNARLPLCWTLSARSQVG